MPRERIAPRAPAIRFKVEPAYAPPEKIARRLCLTEDQFRGCARRLYARGFPLPDETTGMYLLPAVNCWLDKRPRAVAECMAEAAIDRAVDEAQMPAFARIGHVYCIGYANYVKIGHTVHKLEYRLKALQTASPEKLNVLAVIVGSKTTERDLHKRFADLRLQGEWFRRESALAEWINAGCPL